MEILQVFVFVQIKIEMRGLVQLVLVVVKLKTQLNSGTIQLKQKETLYIKQVLIQ